MLCLWNVIVSYVNYAATYIVVSKYYKNDMKSYIIIKVTRKDSWKPPVYMAYFDSQSLVRIGFSLTGSLVTETQGGVNESWSCVICMEDKNG